MLGSTAMADFCMDCGKPERKLEIKPWPELQEMWLPLSTFEKAVLSETINIYGILDPVLLLPDGRIIDGYHRWKIATERGLEVPYKIMDISEHEAIKLAIALNMGRRSFSYEQLREVLKPLFKKTFMKKEPSTGVQMERIKLLFADVPKTRVSIPKKEYEKIYERWKRAESGGGA